MQNYNVFCLRTVEGLCCAVPESRTVPHFLGGGHWSFGGKIADLGAAPIEFDDRAAETAVRFNGFYLFQTMDRRFH
ncbi:hypothetical protein ASF22_13440 [Methylobacterium sp. Leaf87]|uniref:hypothetical protein n=1 Tax=Methylobacterium sp. Leaf87 TaxID=1736243 RepID=UPI0006F9CBAE|nr:hypothetical protein [Methylobacterium sp. Leaf87]KQO72043.1 hypothetical protein ASF22_13440 [Methylobacterium sp. Leaf87]USU32001.1 hypothetical protein NG677_22445 [Methylobacterium sp. OTU13CASTA1]